MSKSAKILKRLLLWVLQEPHFLFDLGALRLMIYCPLYNCTAQLKVPCLNYKTVLCPKCGEQLLEPTKRGQWILSYFTFFGGRD